MSKFYKPIGNKMCVFPVGAVYLTMIKENPSKYYGGTWELISGGYIYATESNSLSKTTYGGWHARETKLKIEQIPSHDHIFYYNTNSEGLASGQSVAARSSASNDIQKNGDYTFYSWTQKSGGGQGHSHNIATIDVFMYKRTA